MSETMSVLLDRSLTQCYIGDGVYSYITRYGTDVTAASATFTATTATATAAASWATGQGAAGDLVVTESGNWGVLTGALTASGGNRVATVDRWRGVSGEVNVIPAAGGVRILQGKSRTAGYRKCRIQRIVLIDQDGSGVLTIKDTYNSTELWKNPAFAVNSSGGGAGGFTFTFDFTDGSSGSGLPIDGLLSFTTNSACLAVVTIVGI